MRYVSTSNQIGFGVGYRRSTIYDLNRHMIWVNFGYTSMSWSWKRNPARPTAEEALAATEPKP